MQGDILFPLYLLTVKQWFPTFLFDFFFLVFLFYYMSTASPALSALTGLAVHAMPSAFGSHLFSPSWTSLVLLVLLVCPACPPLALAFVWVGLCPFKRATFIGWCPLEPPRWSLGVVRWHGGALLVLLFLLFDLLNDLSDLPLCRLLERHHNAAWSVNRHAPLTHLLVPFWVTNGVNLFKYII